MSVEERLRVDIKVDPRAVRGARLRDRLALMLPPLVAAAATLNWFPLNRFLAAGDVIPFISDGLGGELTSYWNHRTSGAGATTPVIARAVEVAVMHVVEIFGGSETIAQHVFYAALMAFAAFGAAYLARAFVEQPLAVAAAGLLGVFNPFVLIRLPNPLMLVWLGLVAIAAGTLIRVARGAPKSVIGFAALTVPAAYLSLNPPLLVIALLSVGAVALGCGVLVGPGGRRRAGRFLGRALPWAIGFNAWWLVPLVMSTVAREGVTVAAETRVEDWSWSHAQNTLPNVVALTADWGWRYPEFMPYAQDLDTVPVSWLRWILPSLALAAPFLAAGRRRKAALGLLGAGVLGVFLAKGLHAPLESFSLWLYHHVPGMWLLREPVSKIGGIVLLVEVILAAITLSALLGHIKRLSLSFRASGLAIGGVAVGLALAFPSPLWTGAFGPDGKHGLPSAEVAIPRGWRQLADVVNRSPVPGKALELPLDAYYQVTTKWGYHGADDFAANLLRRPVLQLLPHGYLAPAGEVTELLRGTERALIKGDTERARNLLRVLGVSHIVVRHDLTNSQVVRAISDPERLGAGLAAIADVGRPREFGVADLYTVAGGAELAWAPHTVVGLMRRNAERRVDDLAKLGPGTVAVSPESLPLDTLSWEVPAKRMSHVRFSLREPGNYEIGLSGRRPTRWVARVQSARFASVLELSDPLRAELDGTPIPGAPTMTVPITDTEVQAVELDGRLFVLDGRQTMLPIDGASNVRALGSSAPPSAVIPTAAVGTCGPGIADASRRRIPRGLELRVRRGLACATVPGPALSPEGLYRVRVQIRNPKGAPTRLLCLWQHGPDTCAPMAQPFPAREWSTFDAAVHTAPGVTGLTLYLYADAGAGTATTAQFRDVSITPLRTVGAGTVVPGTRAPARLNLGRGEHLLHATQPDTAIALRANSPLGDCQRTDQRTTKEVGLAVRSIPRGVELAADEHTACVQAAIPDLQPGVNHTLTLDVRTISGSRARICVWQDGPNQCATTRELPGNSDWSPYVTTFQLDPTTTSARLYLYADGNDVTRTVTQYRGLELRSGAPSIVDIRGTGRRSVPHVRWHENNPDALSITMDHRAPEQILVVNEAYGSGWGLAGSAAERHVIANGYANAWLLTPDQGTSFEARYGPSRWAHLALVVSLIAAFAAVMLLLVRRFRPQRLFTLSDDRSLELPSNHDLPYP